MENKLLQRACDPKRVSDMFFGGKRLDRSATALLCVVLMVSNLLIHAGCIPTPVALAGSQFHRDLAVGDDVYKLLQNSPLAGATALDFDPLSGRLTLSYPNGARGVEATLRLHGDQPRLASLKMSNGVQWARVEFDDERRITTLRTATGHAWQRPIGWTGRRPSASSVGLDPYLAANAELLEYAHQLDRDQTLGGSSVPGSSVTPPGGAQPPTDKPPAGALEDPLASILTFLGVVLGVEAVFANSMLFFYTVIWLFQATLILEIVAAILGGSSPALNVLEQGILHIENQLSGETPLWRVFTISTDGSRSEDLLAGQAIPAGSSRDFAVTTGQYYVAVWAPATGDCFREYVHANVIVERDLLIEIVVAAEDASQVVPEGCNGG